MSAESHAVKEDMMFVELEGPVNFATVPALRKRLLGFARTQAGKNLHVDLSRVTMVDTAGVAMLVETWRFLERRSGVLHLTGLSESARKLIQLARLDQVFRIEDGAK